VLKVIFVDEPSQPESCLPRRSLLSRRSFAEEDDEAGDFLQRASLSLLAAVVLFLGIAPAPLVSRIVASLP
jgi:hypothetical protein